jgi:hypothetical protein
MHGRSVFCCRHSTLQRLGYKWQNLHCRRGYPLRTFASVQQDVFVGSGRWRLIQLDRAYADLHDILGPCEIDGVRWEVVAVPKQPRSTPWAAGETVVVEVNDARPGEPAIK